MYRNQSVFPYHTRQGLYQDYGDEKENILKVKIGTLGEKCYILCE